MATTLSHTEKQKLYKFAFGLAVFTIFYNIAEGLVSTYLGYEAESLTLFGFGADSFIEVVSGLGIAHMLYRIQQHPDSNRNKFERTALRVTGFAFYALVVLLVVTALYNIGTGHKPESTFWGVVISVISIVVMLVLIYGKTKVGTQLNSDAILADAECTRVCIYMSVILLLSSGIYELTNFAYTDSIGSLALAYFSFKEGKECFDKAKSDKLCTCG
ncbi:MAG: cation transporter [Bacteroidetes bacterium]|nr:cation transporter [Bacteroidota bacterium]MBK8658269.1 cation transporter [Bacteroidota bacterium]